jgi:hypothetical protein
MLLRAVWFKVAEEGYKNGKWAATDVLTGENNSIARFTIPASLKAGQYLIRSVWFVSAPIIPR